MFAADGQPWAELWLGTHPNGPTTTTDGQALSELTGELPYLLKVLAAAEPLSLQVHPTASQAVDGFARGVYPDDRAKPELLCALTRFDALCGVRPVEATLTLLDSIGADGLAQAMLRSDGVGATIESISGATSIPQPTIVACQRSGRVEAQLVTSLAGRYPGERAPSSRCCSIASRCNRARRST